MPEPAPESPPPLPDPLASRLPPPRKYRTLILLLVAVAFIVAAYLIYRDRPLPAPSAPASVITVRPTPDVLVAVRDLGRLETAQVHVEKVIDLTDTQSRMFGLVEATDAILLVAAGDATLGVDLAKLAEGDVSMDPLEKTARVRLPPVELLQIGLDEEATYVYTRSTSMLARRNEQLESKARREAVESIRSAALSADMLARARAQAERQIRALCTSLGAARVEIEWRN